MNQNENEFEQALANQVRLKRRQDLLTMFAGFEVEQAKLTNNPNETNEGSFAESYKIRHLPVLIDSEAFKN